MKNIIIIGNRAVGKTALAKAIQNLNPEQINWIIIDSIEGSCISLKEMYQALELINKKNVKIEVQASIIKESLKEIPNKHKKSSLKITKQNPVEHFFTGVSRGKGARARNRTAFNNKFRK
jgi:predicted AAA+ superfamily ATPase